MRTIEEKCSSETVIVDYRHCFIRFTDTVRLLPISTNLKEIQSGLKTLSQRVGRLKKFKTFQKKYYKLT